MRWKSTPPDRAIPRVWCDFNAYGWSGTPGDRCYYVFDGRALDELKPVEGLRLFAWDDDGDGTVVGCEVMLERYVGRATGPGWRLCPDEDTWYSGPVEGLPDR